MIGGARIPARRLVATLALLAVVASSAYLVGSEAEARGGPQHFFVFGQCEVPVSRVLKTGKIPVTVSTERKARVRVSVRAAGWRNRHPGPLLGKSKAWVRAIRRGQSRNDLPVVHVPLSQKGRKVIRGRLRRLKEAEEFVGIVIRTAGVTPHGTKSYRTFPIPGVLF